LEYPPAIREDHDHLGVMLHAGWLGPLAFLRWTSYCCPHCHSAFRRDFWPHNVRLGTGERICRNCAQVFDDGSREWPELRFVQKLRFLLPPGILAMTGAILFCAIFTLCIAPSDVVNWRIGVIIIGSAFSPTVLWLLVRLLPVFRSRRRYENDLSSARRRLVAGRAN
jgi:hypothetical protein